MTTDQLRALQHEYGRTLMRLVDLDDSKATGEKAEQQRRKLQRRLTELDVEIARVLADRRA